MDSFSNKYSSEDISKIILLQNIVKKQLDLKKKIQTEIEFLFGIVNKIVFRINESYLANVINQNEYKQYMDFISETYLLLNKFPYVIKFSDIKKQSRYSIMLLIAKIKLKFINIVQKIGSKNVLDILKLILNIDLESINLTKKYRDLIHFYSKIFNPTSCDIYESNHSENISFKLYNYGETITKSSNNIKLTSFQLDYPTCNKISIFTKTLLQKLYGAKLYFPYKNKLLVIYGYFIKDDFNISRQEPFLKDKLVKLTSIFSSLDIPKAFKENYLIQVSIKDFILYGVDDISNNCITAYNDLKKLKTKNISSLVKEFLLNDLEKQRYYITILVLDTDDTDSHYLAYLLYDLISSDNTLVTNNTQSHQFLYSSLHWSVQKLFKNSQKNIECLNEKLMNFNEDSIPYEKRIHLMKASNYVKSKALDKLKEINSSKDGETNAKAQQYLDALLNIPFGCYKKNYISHKFEESGNKIKRLLVNVSTELTNIEESLTIDEDSLKYVGEL